MQAAILNVLKPPGMTSHDVVDFVRRLVGRRVKVGHAGTLDPAAAGVLVVCVGAATRLIEYLVEGEKAYRAEVCLGVATDSLDAEGRVLTEQDASHLTEVDVRRALEGLVGPQRMTPPMFSAAQVNGKRLYELARAGQSVEREARPVEVHAAELVAFSPGRRALALVDFRCSKGTYVRVLCAQLGECLGLGAHLAFLVRTAVGTHQLGEAATLEELAAAAARERLHELAEAPASALAHVPALTLGEADSGAFRQGLETACSMPQPGLVRVQGPGGDLLGIGEIRVRGGQSLLRPRKVLSST
jgi:tRNA pseudouridine55 synthase